MRRGDQHFIDIIQPLLNQWSVKLGLAGRWHIHIELADIVSNEVEVNASVSVNDPYKKALLTFSRPGITRDANRPELEYTIIHELLHIVVAEELTNFIKRDWMTPEQFTSLGDRQEGLIDTLSVILFDLAHADHPETVHAH